MATLRIASRDDEPEIRRIEAATWSPRSNPGPPPDPDRPFFERLGAENVIVAVAGEAPVGYLILGPWSTLESSRHVLEVKGLSVDPTYQGEGIGSRLLAGGITRARREGKRRLVLRVLSGNDGARRLYERHGFVAEGGVREAFLLDGAYVDDLVMALDLNS